MGMSPIRESPFPKFSYMSSYSVLHPPAYTMSILLTCALHLLLGATYSHYVNMEDKETPLYTV